MQFGNVDTGNEEQAVAFLQYFNNFMLEIPGMKAAREYPDTHLAFIQKCVKSDNQKISLFGWRACLSFCRALTSTQIQPELLEFLKTEVVAISGVQA